MVGHVGPIGEVGREQRIHEVVGVRRGGRLGPLDEAVGIEGAYAQGRGEVVGDPHLLAQRNQPLGHHLEGTGAVLRLDRPAEVPRLVVGAWVELEGAPAQLDVGCVVSQPLHRRLQSAVPEVAPGAYDVGEHVECQHPPTVPDSRILRSWSPKGRP